MPLTTSPNCARGSRLVTMDFGQGCREAPRPTSLMPRAAGPPAATVRNVQFKPPTMVFFSQTTLARWAVAWSCATKVVMGCAPEPAAPPNTDAEDQIVFDRTHRTLATVPLLAYVLELFAADPSWETVDPQITARLAIAVTRARIDFVLGSLQCEREFSTDAMTYLEAKFSNCPLEDVAVDGEFRAEISIETGPCPIEAGGNGTEDTQCNLAVQWTLADPIFTIAKDDEVSASRFSGPLTVRDSIVNQGERMTWETDAGFTLQAAEGMQFTTRSTASWLRDPVTNCIDISLDARLRLTGEGDDSGDSDAIDDIDVGEIVVSATDVHFCTQQCPTRGAIEMAYGTGNILSWTYDGADEVTVRGPGGREFTEELPCPAAIEP